MRLPRIQQLTERQKDVYLYAPKDSHVLVQGPPGTGKTLIACLRAIELAKRGSPVTLGMFNRVLKQFSSNAGDGQKMPSETIFWWFHTWWQESGLPPHPHGGEITVQVDYAQRDEIKRLGGRWNPGAWRPWPPRGKGVWTVEYSIWKASPESLSRWRLWHQPPRRVGQELAIDWTAVSDHLLQHEESVRDAALSLGTLLVDEGQDFPPDFYRFLRQLAAIASARGARIQHPVRCFILADENQQLTEENSTIDSIGAGLKIADGHRYLLLDNFRNTREIAEIARQFFSDVGAIPHLPEARGDLPVYFDAGSPSAGMDFIARWVKNNPRKEVGVLCFLDATREQCVAELTTRLGALQGRSIRVQTYSAKRKELKAEDLRFDVPDTVTVLNLQSCKGLEFDAVFIVDLRQANINMYGPDRFRMQMFVAISRARETVYLIDLGTAPPGAAYLKELPPPEYLARGIGQSGKEAGARSKGSAALVRSSWVDEALRIAGRMTLKVEDHRERSGCFWVLGGPELEALLLPLGFAFKTGKGWWKK